MGGRMVVLLSSEAASFPQPPWSSISRCRQCKLGRVYRHCEERSDEAIHSRYAVLWIASLALAMTFSGALAFSPCGTRCPRYDVSWADEWVSLRAPKPLTLHH